MENKEKSFIEGKKKLKIGIDLDDTILNWFGDFILFCKENFGYELKKERFIYFIKEDFGSDEKFLEALEEYFAQGKNWEIEFFEDFLENFEILSSIFEIYFITARVRDNKIKTNEFLENKIGLNFNLIYKNEFESLSKSDICLNKNILIMIEDDERHAIDCAEAGVKCFLLDKPWNQNCEHENIIRVKDWHEILEKIKEVENGVH